MRRNANSCELDFLYNLSAQLGMYPPTENDSKNFRHHREILQRGLLRLSASPGSALSMIRVPFFPSAGETDSALARAMRAGRRRCRSTRPDQSGRAGRRAVPQAAAADGNGDRGEPALPFGRYLPIWSRPRGLTGILDVDELQVAYRELSIAASAAPNRPPKKPTSKPMAPEGRDRETGRGVIADRRARLFREYRSRGGPCCCDGCTGSDSARFGNGEVAALFMAIAVSTVTVLSDEAKSAGARDMMMLPRCA